MDTILRLLTQSDTAAVIEELARRPDPLQAAKAAHEAMRDFYWRQKNLAATVALGRIGIQHSLAAATVANGELVVSLRSAAKAMCYDLASFTWPGWDEAGIPITPSDLAVGLDAAKANLRLGQELNKGDLPLSRACWMLAGHYLAIRQFDLAYNLFNRAAKQASLAEARADELLSLGFGCLTHLIQFPDDAEASRELDRIKTLLKPLADGEMFVAQIDTAAHALGRI